MHRHHRHHKPDVTHSWWEVFTPHRRVNVSQKLCRFRASQGAESVHWTLTRQTKRTLNVKRSLQSNKIPTVCSKAGVGHEQLTTARVSLKNPNPTDCFPPLQETEDKMFHLSGRIKAWLCCFGPTAKHSSSFKINHFESKA